MVVDDIGKALTGLAEWVVCVTQLAVTLVQLNMHIADSRHTITKIIIYSVFMRL